MISEKIQVNMFELISTISRIVDMMNPAIGNHHIKVAYLAYRIGEALSLPYKKRNELLIAGLLHDIGAFSLEERLDLLGFEDEKPGEHSLSGYVLLRDFNLFRNISEMIKYHHVIWDNGRGRVHHNEDVQEGSHIIHLADRISVMISHDMPILSQVENICQAISQSAGKRFVPKHVDAFLRIAKHDYIWLEVTSVFIEKILKKIFYHWVQELSADELISFSDLVCRLIDFKSEFTATHSRGVSATSVLLAEYVGFSKNERKFIEIAALLHDLGKLVVPLEILEKVNKLDNSEWFVMRSHVYYTYQALEQFKTASDISAWGALHQERLDGSGYPFGYKEEELSLGSRIIAVADVFTGLTENRPYRKGMSKSETMDVLHTMKNNKELDGKLVNRIFSRFDEFLHIREIAQRVAAAQYHEFQQALCR